MVGKLTPRPFCGGKYNLLTMQHNASLLGSICQEHSQDSHRPLLWQAIIFASLVLAVTGCSPGLQFHVQVNQLLERQQYAEALKLFDSHKNAYGSREKLLFFLDKGAVAHYAGRWEESIGLLSKADLLLEEAYTRSVSQEAATFLINDNMRDYSGEDFESAMVNLFQALNYAALGMWDDALVEARRVDIKLNLFNDQYPEQARNVYREDAFIRFLMGLLYESQGAVNDAFIEYKKALETYRNQYWPVYRVSPPPILARKMLQAARQLDFDQEAQWLLDQYPELTAGGKPPNQQTAEIVIIHYNGPGAEKEEASFWVTMPDGFVLKLAYPKFVDRHFSIVNSQMVLTDTQGSKTSLCTTFEAENIAAIARVNLQNRIARIKAKAVARVTAKYLAALAVKRQVEKKHNQNLGFLVQIITQGALLATENADTRQWRMLPASIRIGLGTLEPGTWQGEMKFFDAGGKVVATRQVRPFTVMPGQKFFLIVRTVR